MLWPVMPSTMRKDFGVDVEEAICRLSLQDEIGELGAELAANERDTFAGLRIQHQPDFRGDRRIHQWRRGDDGSLLEK